MWTGSRRGPPSQPHAERGWPPMLVSEHCPLCEAQLMTHCPPKALCPWRRCSRRECGAIIDRPNRRAVRHGQPVTWSE